MGTGLKPSGRLRIRELLPQLFLGRWQPGRLNSITDVPGVLVHTESIQPDRDVNTGVTTILPRADWHKYGCHAAIFKFNGAGEMTGSHWIDETGILTSPIILTTNSSIGEGFRGVYEYVLRYHATPDGDMGLFTFPVVTETYDGYLSKQSRFAVTPEHIVQGIVNASSDPVPEGSTGGGTGMICHRFKGGTGSSSRIVSGLDQGGNRKDYTVGVLVQANYGQKEDLRIGGVPVGRILSEDLSPTPTTSSVQGPLADGSIIIIVATDIPLLPVQLQRLAKRATVGLSRVGGYGSNGSGDIFIAFSTAAKIPMQQFEGGLDPYKPSSVGVETVENESINGVFEAVADATEEAIYNVLCMAETMTGYKGRTVEALNLDKVKEIVIKRL
ncbi:d-aminopeptidase [Fusarium longipes]|uniref:D-aminopeptidase n=1 Tax=Fusarium longipes TaxID=694270 RepID=A0A395T8L6_9HYPO|nr:d-aminopeptidase [Fusarium longipes]